VPDSTPIERDPQPIEPVELALRVADRFASDAAVIEALLAEVSAPSVAAVRRARRYSVAVLVARGADL
jgi:hypothetical protein